MTTIHDTIRDDTTRRAIRTVGVARDPGAGRVARGVRVDGASHQLIERLARDGTRGVVHGGAHEHKRQKQRGSLHCIEEATAERRRRRTSEARATSAGAGSDRVHWRRTNGGTYDTTSASSANESNKQPQDRTHAQTHAQESERVGGRGWRGSENNKARARGLCVCARNRRGERDKRRQRRARAATSSTSASSRVPRLSGRSRERNQMRALGRWRAYVGV